MSGLVEKALDDGAEVDIDQTRAEFQEAAREEAANGRTLPRIAEAAGIAYPTLHAWSKSKYNGDNNGVARRVANWLLNRSAREQTRMTVRAAPGFMKTKTAVQIIDALEYAHSAPEMVLISMPSGLGKTTAIEAYQKRAANVWIVTGEPAITTPGTFLLALSTKLNMPCGGNVWRISNAIQNRLRGSEGLVIVDEAQHLQVQVRDQLRQTVFDGAGIGVALVGNETLNETFGRERNRGQHAQLISRIGQRITRERPTRNDVEMLLEGWAINDEAVRERAMGIAMKPGALRQLTKALRIACALSDARGDVEPAPADIDAAWKQLGGTL